MSLCWFTVSKAFDMSRDTRMVRCGFFWLKPSTMVLVMLLRAVTVECLGLNPCCVGLLGISGVMWGRSVFSRTLAMGDSNDIGR